MTTTQTSADDTASPELEVAASSYQQPELRIVATFERAPGDERPSSLEFEILQVSNVKFDLMVNILSLVGLNPEAAR